MLSVVPRRGFSAKDLSFWMNAFPSALGRIANTELRKIAER